MYILHENMARYDCVSCCCFFVCFFVLFSIKFNAVSKGYAIATANPSMYPDYNVYSVYMVYIVHLIVGVSNSCKINLVIREIFL